MVSLARMIGGAILVLLVLGCGSGQEKGQNKDLDRPKSTDKGTKPTCEGVDK